MKILLSIIASIWLCGVSYAQSGNNPEHVIRRMISCSCSEGHDSKVIGGMGDAAAVLVTKIIAGGTVTTEEIDSILVILNMSFVGQAPEASDQEPRTALFVLQYCDSATKDPELRKRIAKTREYVQKTAHSQ